MTEKSQYIKHIFGGGWATDFGPTADAVQIEGNQVVVPWLNEAEDIVFMLDGGARKAPGTSKLTSSALESGADVMGIFDAWISGTGGSSSQHRIIHVGTTIKKDDGDGSFSNLFTGLQAGKIPSYAMLEDLIIMTSDSTSDVPKSWDGSTAQNLAGSPPNFAFAEEHKNRMWAAGDVAKPSRLYYSTLLNAADWASQGSGSIDISPDDGDRITAIRSHKDQLWIFKGPYNGSIHRITGSAPTGADAFSRFDFVRGLGAVSNNSVFRFADDLGYMWKDGSVHSLAITAKFGDFNQSALSLPIQSWLRGHVNFTQLKKAHIVANEDEGYALISIPIDGSSSNSVILMMDFRFNPVRWAKWPSFMAISLGYVVDPTDSNRSIVMAGGTDGHVRKYGRADRTMDGATGLSYKLTLPFLNYGTSIMIKTLDGASLSIAPKNDGNITFGWVRDNGTQQTKDISQGGSDVLGTAAVNQFTLGTSTLGGALFSERFVDLIEGGEFRSIQYEAKNAVNFEDVEIHSISAAIEGGSWSTEND